MTVTVERRVSLVANTIRVKSNVRSEGFKNIIVRRNSVVVGNVLGHGVSSLDRTVLPSDG